MGPPIGEFIKLIWSHAHSAATRFAKGISALMAALVVHHASGPIIDEAFHQLGFVTPLVVLISLVILLRLPHA